MQKVGLYLQECLCILIYLFLNLKKSNHAEALKTAKCQTFKIKNK